MLYLVAVNILYKILENLHESRVVLDRYGKPPPVGVSTTLVYPPTPTLGLVM